MTVPELAQSVWRKSSYSSDEANCVEVAFAGWHKSSYSSSEANCVEVAHAPAVVGVRDTKDRDGGALTLTPAAWTAFLHAQH